MLDRDNGASTALISFILGGIAGAAVAVLFAPATGQETRQRIGEGVRDGAERGRAFVQKGRDALEAATRAGRHPAPGNGLEPGDVSRVPEPGLPSTSGPASESPA